MLHITLSAARAVSPLADAAGTCPHRPADAQEATDENGRVWRVCACWVRWYHDDHDAAVASLLASSSQARP